jgi:hypothetical protein
MSCHHCRRQAGACGCPHCRQSAEPGECSWCYSREHASGDHFDDAFSRMTPPPDIRSAAVRICQAYGIRGICDPGYIANVIAHELGRGDGLSNFCEESPA